VWLLYHCLRSVSESGWLLNVGRYMAYARQPVADPVLLQRLIRLRSNFRMSVTHAEPIRELGS